MTFDLANFLENAGVGRKVVQMQPKQSSFRREARLTPSSIFGQAAQNSQSFLRTARKP
jgi:hypothetical protein